MRTQSTPVGGRGGKGGSSISPNPIPRYQGGALENGSGRLGGRGRSLPPPPKARSRTPRPPVGREELEDIDTEEMEGRADLLKNTALQRLKRSTAGAALAARSLAGGARLSLQSSSGTLRKTGPGPPPRSTRK